MEVEIVKVKIVGMKAQNMLEILLNSGKISFPNPILGVNITKILNGRTGKYVLPDQKYDYIDKNKRGNYMAFEMEDKSEVIIEVQEEDTLLFEFITSEERMLGLQETVLNYIDYEYGKVKKVEEGKVEE
jgi:hypothetical protein